MGDVMLNVELAADGASGCKATDWTAWQPLALSFSPG